MTVSGDCLQVFSFSVMQSSFGFANVEILTVTTTSFIYNFEHLRTVEPIFVGEKRLDAMCVLENNPKVKAFTYTSLHSFMQIFSSVTFICLFFFSFTLISYLSYFVFFFKFKFSYYSC